MVLFQRIAARSIRFGVFRTPAIKTIPSDFYTTFAHRGPSSLRFQHSSSFNRGNVSTNKLILYGAIGVNCAIFLYAQHATQQARQGFPENLKNFYRNFTINYNDVVQEGKWWTVITSTFSHIQPFHLLGNMLSAYYMGGLVAQTPGVRPLHFVILILGSGISGSLLYLGMRHQKLQEHSQKNTRGGAMPRDMKRGLGFSGALMGVGAVAAFMYPRTTFAIYGIIPVPLWALMMGYAVFDGAFLTDTTSRVAHAGHLGGLAFGVMYYFAKFRGIHIPRY